MTHDELLSKIDKRFEQTSGVGFMIHHNTCVKFDCDCGLIDDRHKQLHKALRAVVELHKPVERENYLGVLMCDGCEYSSWPCPTIKAIQEALQ